MCCGSTLQWGVGLSLLCLQAPFVAVALVCIFVATCKHLDLIRAADEYYLLT